MCEWLATTASALPPVAPPTKPPPAPINVLPAPKAVHVPKPREVAGLEELVELNIAPTGKAKAKAAVTKAVVAI